MRKRAPILGPLDVMLSFFSQLRGARAAVLVSADQVVIERDGRVLGFSPFMWILDADHVLAVGEELDQSEIVAAGLEGKIERIEILGPLSDGETERTRQQRIDQFLWFCVSKSCGRLGWHWSRPLVELRGFGDLGVQSVAAQERFVHAVLQAGARAVQVAS